MKSLFSIGRSSANINGSLNRLHSINLPVIPSGGDRCVIEYFINMTGSNGTISINVYEPDWSSLTTTISTFGNNNGNYIVRLNIFNDSIGNIQVYGEIIDTITGISNILYSGFGNANKNYNLTIESLATGGNQGDITVISCQGIYINQI